MNTIPHMLEETLAVFSQRYVFPEEKITYQQAISWIKKRANYLKKCGVNEKTPVGLIAFNSKEWMLSFLSISYLGGIVVPLDPNLSEDLHLAMLKKVDVKHVFISDEFNYEMLDFHVHKMSLEESLDKEELSAYAPVQEEDVAAYLFTSGTTGDPKIVMLSHANFIATAKSAGNHMKINSSDVLLCVLPLYHIYSLETNLMAVFSFGMGVVIQPSLKGPDILNSLENNRITIFAGVPQMWELFFDSIAKKVKNQSSLKFAIFMFMVKHAHIFNKIGLKSIPHKIFKPIHKVFGEDLRFLVSGGAALKPVYFDRYMNMGFNIIEGYGLSETTGPIVATKADQNMKGSVGDPIAGISIQIRNLDEKTGIGEVWAKGISIMLGYYKNVKATQEVFDPDGWFYTGDLGKLNKQGKLVLTGRKKNVIVLDNGKNVYPEEIEFLLESEDAIKEAAVFGYKKNNQTIVLAVIGPNQNSNSAIKEAVLALKKVNLHLPFYAKIVDFAVSLEPLPRTSTKKIIIRDVLNNYQKGLYVNDFSSFDNLTEHSLTAINEKQQIILDNMKKTFKVKEIFYGQTLDSLGMDSLSKIQWAIELEKLLIIKLEMNVFMKINELSDLFVYLESCPEQVSDNKGMQEIFSSEIKYHKQKFFNPLISLILASSSYLAKKKFSLTIQGVEKLNNLNNCILVANHQSNIDAPLILASLPKSLRKDIYIIGKKEVNFLKYLFPFSHTIFVDRKGNVLPALKAGSDLLRQKSSLLLFPEGTRTRDGSLGSFKKGAASLAQELGVKIVPIAINGSGKVLPRGKFFLQWGNQLSIKIANPLDPKQFDSLEALNQALKNSIQSLL